jgi:hypothetical protein
LGTAFADENKTGKVARFRNPDFAMPKLNKGDVPKLCKNGSYAVVYSNGTEIRPAA